MFIEDVAGGREVDPADFGGHLVRHQHDDLTAVAHVYSRPGRSWAECTMCAADLELAVPALRQDRLPAGTRGAITAN